MKLYKSNNHIKDFLTCVERRTKPVTSEIVRPLPIAWPAIPNPPGGRCSAEPVTVSAGLWRTEARPYAAVGSLSQQI